MRVPFALALEAMRTLSGRRQPSKERDVGSGWAERTDQRFDGHRRIVGIAQGVLDQAGKEVTPGPRRDTRRPRTRTLRCRRLIMRTGYGSGRRPWRVKFLNQSKTWIYSDGVATDPADLLRHRGIQVTAQRLAVLRAVAAEPHITADAVAEAVRAGIGAISLQSVYDALGVLVAEGLIRRIQPSGSPARFEDRVGDNHHHLICRICGRVVDVECAVGFRALSHGGRRERLRDRRGRGRLLGALSGLPGSVKSALTIRSTYTPAPQQARGSA